METNWTKNSKPKICNYLLFICRFGEEDFEEKVVEAVIDLVCERFPFIFSFDFTWFLELGMVENFLVAV